ncbi:MAG: GDSL-type esterase/lipase family protein [Eubacteriales bacterium]|nr:GDSL-type esterase/lipase family protein [Eubacteriales bacterium]MDD4422432.1 GDSL-type esterase/lipase family protein [Eubacteriales bacterium]HBR31313.1 hypothetical protein [Clostridiales bacterium]
MKKIIMALLAALFCFASVPFFLNSASAAGDGPIIVAFGDSLTAAGVFVNTLRNEYGLNIINAGVGGNNTNDARARFNRDVLSNNPDVVLIGFGMNDSARDMAKYVDIESFRNNLRYFCTTLKDKGIKVVLFTSNYIEENKYYTRHDRKAFEPYGGAAAFVDTYYQAVRDVAKEQSVYLADVRALCDGFSNRILIVTDGVHCTELGYSLYSSAIGEEIKKIFLGDANLDGSVTAADYYIIKRNFLGTYEIPLVKKRYADVNGDGQINASDYIKVKRHFLGTYDLNEK